MLKNFKSISLTHGSLTLHLINVALSFVVPLVAIAFLTDDDIVGSQVITASAQVATLTIAIKLSAVSLETANFSWHSGLRAILTISIICWFIFAFFSPHINQNLFMATSFFCMSCLGEMSAIWRGAIINSFRSRNLLIKITFLTHASRLICFLFLQFWIGYFESFIWSATFSNCVRIIVTYIMASRNFSERAEKRSIPLTNVGLKIRIISFFERNPSVVIVLLLSNFPSIFGLAIEDYAIAIPLMNISIAIAGLTWNQFENISNVSLFKVFIYLCTAAFVFSALIVIATFIPISNFIQAQSFQNLKSSPLLLVFGPVIFGFSTGLAVFTYGRASAIYKVILIVLNFSIFGSFGFYFGAIINCFYFWFESRKFGKV